MTDASPRPAHTLLLASTFVIATCGLVYELLAGTISSYLLGDSVYQFSLVIGLFMAAMGLGSWLSRFVGEALIETFIWAQVAIAAVGGTSAIVLFNAFSALDAYTPFLLLELVVVGSLVGLEIPLVIRILRDHLILKLNVSNVLTADYAGALFASLLFPLVLVPQLGLIRTSLLFGLLNALVAGLTLWAFRDRIAHLRSLTLALAACAAGLGFAFVKAENVLGFFESRLYAGEIILATTTPYQRVVVTRYDDTVNLFINGALQFSSRDEYRYHEALVHPAMSLARRHQDVLVLGGGDGLAVRELLKHPEIGRITLVDLDPAITDLFRDNELLSTLNDGALSDPRVTIVNTDAWKFLEETDRQFDVTVIDLPDPHSLSLSKLYSRSFYALLAQRLRADGLLVTQATSPVFARDAFWSIVHTLETTPSPYALDSGLTVRPFHAYVPSFGEWGFVVAGHAVAPWDSITLNVPTRFLDAPTLRAMAHFPPDMARTDVEANTLQTHALPRYYESGWEQWFK